MLLAVSLCWLARSAAYQLMGGKPGVRSASVPAGVPCVAMVVSPSSRSSESASSGEEAPSYDNTWYAVGFSQQLKEDKVFATRLWGEPIALYRDAQGEAVCVRDVCPHRSAPLSMGEVENGELRCFYHGWAFGKQGKCTDVPTIPMSGSRRPNLDPFCATTYSLVESDNMLWVWRGHLLAADSSKLPAQPLLPPREEAPAMLRVDSTLDFAVDWSEVLRDGLSTPHLTPLLSGEDDEAARETLPPLARALLTALAKDGGWGRGASGSPQAGSSEQSGRFESPNRISHRSSAASGAADHPFWEGVHVVPIAPGRTRVLLRQHLPLGPLLAQMMRVPAAQALLTSLVQGWNQQAAYMSASRIESVADSAASKERGEVARFAAWTAKAGGGRAPYFRRWDSTSGPAAELGQQMDDDAAGTNSGTYGLKKSYVQNNPTAEYAPMVNAGPKEVHSVGEAAGGVLKTAAAAAISVPAALITYNTLGPSIAALLRSGPA